MSRNEEEKHSKLRTAKVTRGDCLVCRQTVDRFCMSCRKSVCATCHRGPCPSCAREINFQTAQEMWTSLIMVAGLERWVNEGWEDDHTGQKVYPDSVAYQSAKTVLAEHWTLQKDHPRRSFALPIVTLDVIDRGMFIDFRSDDKKNVVCCYCDKKGNFIVSCRSKGLEKTFKDPAKVASLLDQWIREHLFPE